MDTTRTTTLEHSAPLESLSHRQSYFWSKRVMDATLATVALVVLAPVMLVIAALIKLDSAGPVFFKQKRVGARLKRQDGRLFWETVPFYMIKFRSMVPNADESVHQAHIKAFAEGTLASSNSNGARFKLSNDPRVTRVGRILRRTSLDELPQLFNVLRGEMSLVGPRPVPTYEVAQYQPWHQERLFALPGITGLWQVMGRSTVRFDDMVRMDIDYVRKASLWLDIKLILLTIPAVLTGRGAG